jgi:hypothetical protein
MDSSDEVSVGVKKRVDSGTPFIPTLDPETWEAPLLPALSA